MTKVRIIREVTEKPIAESLHTAGSAADWTEMRNLPVGDLHIDPKYQRDLDMKWAQTIADNFKPDLLEVIQVSYRDGKFHVIDGQHRKKGVELRFRDPNYPVTCKVYYGLTEAEEGELFYLFNKCKKRMTDKSMMKAQAFFGEEEVSDFFRITKEMGFIIDPVERKSCKYGILAVKKARTCYQALGAEAYGRMLRLIRMTWDGERWSLSQNMLGGMARLIAVFGDDLDDKGFSSKLKFETETTIKREASTYGTTNPSNAFASALLSFYNKGRRTKRLDPSRL